MPADSRTQPVRLLAAGCRRSPDRGRQHEDLKSFHPRPILDLALCHRSREALTSYLLVSSLHWRLMLPRLGLSTLPTLPLTCTALSRAV
ncbi:hypothetical protein L596_005139 [Steinernema carpocapsae]|uniref:Uncharacterized protein n=1 Tax=Steinernema carpocapsae TaxID=34508 RepID=A0A4U8V1N2_STECR|nr:hypothetical protein L596_005139 [Steinernema carpocapsae]